MAIRDDSFKNFVLDQLEPLGELVLKEIQSTHPLSVTMKEKVDSLREWARQRTVPAN